MRNTIILFLLVFGFHISSAHLPGDDHSAPAIADTAKINELISSVKKILYVYPDSANDMINIILDSSEKYQYQNGIFTGINLKANLLLMKGASREAIHYFNKGFEYCDTLNHPRRMAILLSNMGLSFLNLSNYDTAIYYYNQAYEYSLRNNINSIRNKVMYDLSLIHLEKSNYLEAYKNLKPLCDTFRAHNDTMRLILAYSSLGVLYTKIGDFDSAFHYYSKANKLDSRYLPFNNKSNYNNIGELYFRVKQDYDSALIYFRKSYNNSKGVNESYLDISTNINIGNVFYEKGMYDSAYHYYSIVHNDPLTQYYPYQQSAVLINIGEYFRKNNDYNKSREYLKKGITLAESHGYIEFLAVGYVNLSGLDSCEGNWYEALHNYKKYKFYVDSLNQLGNQNEIAKLDMDRYVLKKKYDNRILKKENIFNQKLIANQRRLLILSLAGLLILLPIVIMIYINRSKIKRLLAERSISHRALETLTGELKASNQELQLERRRLDELNNTKDKFFSILSHDLKGPFASFIGLLQILKDTWEDMPDKEKKDNINKLLLSANNTSELLGDILEWGKTQEGKLEYQPEIFNVYRHLSSVTELYHMQASSKEINIELNVPDDLDIKTDPRYFRQIMQNLLNNAIKFSYRGGKISIDYSKTENGMDFCVSDEGTGIPEDKLDEIFSITSKYRMSGTENEKSTGMGLILSIEYASIINAELFASSAVPDPARGVAGGSTFCLRFSSFPQ